MNSVEDFLKLLISRFNDENDEDYIPKRAFNGDKIRFRLEEIEHSKFLSQEESLSVLETDKQIRLLLFVDGTLSNIVNTDITNLSLNFKDWLETIPNEIKSNIIKHFTREYKIEEFLKLI